MTSSHRVADVSSPLLRSLAGTRVPLLVVAGAAGPVRLCNPAAEELFPLLRDTDTFLPPAVPDWLCSGHTERRAAVQGPIGSRTFRALPVNLPDDCTGWLLSDATTHSPALARTGDEQRRALFLLRASALLLASLNPRRCRWITAELAAGELADAAVVLAPDGAGRLSMSTAVRGRRVQECTAAQDAHRLPGLREALTGVPAGPPHRLDRALVPPWLVPDGFGGCGEALLLPLPGHTAPSGALILLRRAGRPAFSRDEEVFARIFAARAGSAVSTATLYADRTGTTGLLQRALIPLALTRITGIDLATAYRPAEDTDLIAGDFYDIHPPQAGPHSNGADPRETLLMLGDVCGKGAAAAILAGRIRTTLAALHRLEPRHTRLLELLNDTLLGDRERRFVTLVLVGATPLDDGSVALRLTSAGHPAPLIVRTDGRVEDAQTGGTLIGALPALVSRTATTVLLPGEVCLLYSDGVTEARGGATGSEMFGEHRLRRVLRECAHMPVEAVVEHIEMTTAQWLDGRAHDDIALLAIAAPHRGAAGGTAASGGEAAR